MGHHIDAKWIAIILVAGYLLGKVITFYVGYRFVRFLWGRYRRRTATSAEQEDNTIPLLVDVDVDSDGAPAGFEINGHTDVESGHRPVKCEIRVHGDGVTVTINGAAADTVPPLANGS
jgi:hypothetical protein